MPCVGGTGGVSSIPVEFGVPLEPTHVDGTLYFDRRRQLAIP